MKHRYFQEELDYLHQTGDEFSRIYPKLTRYLSSKSTDPDVERMLEGFAFLTGKLREKIDDELPEVTETLLQLLWPNFLRPVPSMTILQLNPVKGAITERQKVKAGAMVESVPSAGHVCRFRTSYDTEVYPLKVTDIRHDTSREASLITLRIESLNDEPLSTINIKDLIFYLGAAEVSAQTTNLWIHRYLDGIQIRNIGEEKGITIDPSQILQGGLSKEEAVLPYPENAYIGYRLIQELFAFPQKYHFVHMVDLPINTIDSSKTGFEIQIRLNRPLPPETKIGLDAFQLNCVPAINLFSHDAEPILLDGRHVEYKVRPSLRSSSDIDIFEIKEISGWLPDENAKSGGISRQYPRFESFKHEMERADGRAVVYYREKVKQSLAGDRLDRYVSFVREDETISMKKGETISINTLCSNGRAPADLAIGDVCVTTNSTPSFIKPTNITRPTEPQYPLVDGTLQWQLISSLSLNYMSLQNVDTLRTILLNFDFGAKIDRQKERAAIHRLNGMLEIETETIDRLFKGMPVRGMRTLIKMKESHFASEGEMFLFATVLSEFFALYATINSFHQLEVLGTEMGEAYQWATRIGNQPLI